MIELHNGDCLEVMDRLIENGVKVDLIVTDPPYDIKNRIASTKNTSQITNI
jgi:DNA modification methylase